MCAVAAVVDDRGAVGVGKCPSSGMAFDVLLTVSGCLRRRAGDVTEHLAARGTGAAGPWHYQYRAYPPSFSFFAAPIAVVSGSIVTGFFAAGFHWVLLWYLVCMALAFFLESCISRRVVLSGLGSRALGVRFVPALKSHALPVRAC